MKANDLKSARQSLGLSQSGLAAALGINKRTLQRMESGETLVSLRTQLALSVLVEKL